MARSGSRAVPERRAFLRLRIDVTASIAIPGHAPQPCRVYDISVGGALIDCALNLRLNDNTILHVEDFGPLSARVTRVTSTAAALTFTEQEGALATFLKERAIARGAAKAERAASS